MSAPETVPVATAAPHPSAVAGRLAAWIAAAVVCARAGVDPDLWGHLRFGLDLVRDWRLPSVDPYSFTQDVPWINHEWLSELLFALAYQAGGVAGLLLLKTAILAAAFALIAQVARRADDRYVFWVLAITFIGTTRAAATFRPQLWTILGLAVLANMLACRRRLVWLPLVFVVWANMHGGWIVGAAVATLWTCGRIIDTRAIRAQLPALAAIGASIAATILNPYGWRLWTFLLSTVRMERDITEWRPLWEGADFQPALFWFVTVGIVAATAVLHWRRMTWATALPVTWIGVNALLVGRLVPLFSELAILVVAQAWHVPETSFAPRVSRSAGKTDGRIFVNVAVVALAWLFTAVGEWRCLPINDTWTPDLVTAGALASPQAAGRLVVPFNWGEYAIWHWGPRLRVSIDGRRETVYSNEMLALQTGIASGRPDGIAYLERVRPEYAWLSMPESAAVAEWLTAHGYRIDVQTDRAFVATRSDLSQLAPGPPASGCFP